MHTVGPCPVPARVRTRCFRAFLLERDLRVLPHRQLTALHFIL